MMYGQIPYGPRDVLTKVSNFFVPPPIRIERREQPSSPIPKPLGPSDDGGGPKRPDSDSAQKDNLLKRMRKVDPKQAERYKQRTGE